MLVVVIIIILWQLKLITDDLELSNASMRISLSYLTTKEEIDTFLKVFDEKIKELTLK